MFLEETPAVLSWKKLCEDHGYTNHWTSGQKPHLIKNGKRIDCNISNNVSFVVPGLSASSSSTTPSPASPSSSSQDSEKRAPGDPLHESTEAWRIRSTKFFRMSCLIGCRNSENLVDESVPAESRRNPSHGHRDTSKSSHELPMEPRAKVEPGLGKHSAYADFPKDPNCDICLKTKMCPVAKATGHPDSWGLDPCILYGTSAAHSKLG